MRKNNRRKNIGFTILLSVISLFGALAVASSLVVFNDMFEKRFEVNPAYAGVDLAGKYDQLFTSLTWLVVVTISITVGIILVTFLNRKKVRLVSWISLLASALLCIGGTVAFLAIYSGESNSGLYTRDAFTMLILFFDMQALPLYQNIRQLTLEKKTTVKK